MSLKSDEIISEIQIMSPESHSSDILVKKPLRHRIKEIIWDTLDRSPEERKLIFKLDIFIL